MTIAGGDRHLLCLNYRMFLLYTTAQKPLIEMNDPRGPHNWSTVSLIYCTRKMATKVVSHFLIKGNINGGGNPNQDLEGFEALSSRTCLGCLVISLPSQMMPVNIALLSLRDLSWVFLDKERVVLSIPGQQELLPNSLYADHIMNHIII